MINPEKDMKNILHPWVAQSKPPTSLIIKGEGCYIEDSSGRRLLDFLSGMYSANLGHYNKEIISKMLEELGKNVGTFSYEFAYPSRLALAKRLLEKIPGSNRKISFQSNGTDAVEAAIIMAREVTGRNGVMSQLLSYHGSSTETFTSSAWGTGSHTPNIPGYLYCHPPYHYRCSFCKTKEKCNLNCAYSMRDLINLAGEEAVACVIIEPIIGGIVNELVVEYMEIVEEICREHGIILVVDEALTGFGRTGKLFCYEYAGIDPDIIVIAKGLTAGYAPLSATVVNSRIAEFYENRKFEYGFTHGGHPLACSAALATLDYYENHHIVETVNDTGLYLKKRLLELESESGLISEVRGQGLLFGIEFSDQRFEVARLKEEALDKGLIIDKGKFAISILAPPLIVTRFEIDFAIEALGSILRNIRDR